MGLGFFLNLLRNPCYGNGFSAFLCSFVIFDADFKLNGCLMGYLANTFLLIAFIFSVNVYAECVDDDCKNGKGEYLWDEQLTMSSAHLDEDKKISKIASGSCGDPYKDMTIWNTIAEEEPNLFLYLGDNVYQTEEKNRPDLFELKEAYYRLANNSDFKSLRAKTPVLTIWDDHDYGLNDAGGDWPYKFNSQQLFYEAWAIKDEDPRLSRDGIYHSVLLGPSDKNVHIILLDTRFFRSPLKKTDQMGARYKERYVSDNDPKKTMLGQQQWEWLEEQLKVPARLRLIVSSIQIIANGHGWEAWRTLPNERQKLYQLITDSEATATVFLSGDRHSAAIYEEDENLPFTVTEVTSSSLNVPLTSFVKNIQDEPGPNRMGKPFYQANYGLIEIDWESNTVNLSIKNDSSKTVRSKRVHLGTLDYKAH